jgi:DNA repair exonuclease SbcCD nuclease subunit
MFPGNHDYFNLDECTDHSLEVFSHLPNVILIEKPTLIDGVWFVPYIHSKEELNKVLSEIPAGSVIVGHFEIKGFDYGNGFICPDGTPKHSFKKFKKVLSGHFHKYDEKGNIVFIGTPFSKNFGESNQDKFIGIYDVLENELELVKTSFPKHVTIEIDVSKKGEIPELSDSDYNRVILKGSAAEIAEFQRLDGIRYDEKPDEEESIKVAESENHLTQFEIWAKEQKLDDTLINQGLQILKGVSE